MEPHGIIICPAEGVTWTPMLLCKEDKALMDIAVAEYNKKGSACINRYRQFLQVILVIDFAIPNTNTIHPSYIEGYPPSSRASYITWPPFLRPPKKYWKTWNHFICMHIQPIIHNPRFLPQFYKHANTVHLYKYEDYNLSMFKIQGGARSRLKAIYTNVPYIVDLPFNSSDFYAVDTHKSSKGISIVGYWYHQYPDQVHNENPSLQNAF